MKTVVIAATTVLLATAGCTPPAPPTVEQSCAAQVARQTGNTLKETTIKASVQTAIGKKIYVLVGGTTYACQADSQGNIGTAELQS